MSVDLIVYNYIYQIDSTKYTEIMESSTVSLDVKFELTIFVFEGMTKIHIDCSEFAYLYLNLFNEEQLDEIYKKYPNYYYFFKNLPNENLIKKYWVKDSNAFHGITKNTFLSSDERRKLLYYLRNNIM